jgi:hypothetical protein
MHWLEKQQAGACRYMEFNIYSQAIKRGGVMNINLLILAFLAVGAIAGMLYFLDVKRTNELEKQLEIMQLEKETKWKEDDNNCI